MFMFNISKLLEINIPLARNLSGYLFLIYPLLIFTILNGFIKLLFHKVTFKDYFFRKRILLILIITLITLIFHNAFYKEQPIHYDKNNVKLIFINYDKNIYIDNPIKQDELLTILNKYKVKRVLYCNFDVTYEFELEYMRQPIPLPAGYYHIQIMKHDTPTHHLFISEYFQKVMNDDSCDKSYQYSIINSDNQLLNEIKSYYESVQ